MELRIRNTSLASKLMPASAAAALIEGRAARTGAPDREGARARRALCDSMLTGASTAPELDGAGKGVTQFGRALYELNVDAFCANTSQAKGCACRWSGSSGALRPETFFT
ncbi:hypothetical protein P5W99_37885 [Paraburkholderia sp. A3BS-1L]|uniref:hypothetical protein n=1 Tax=Paraburkholderia sp. A3BS-1L TaxID=3028375 RepID=UPI003DA9A314